MEASLPILFSCTDFGSTSGDVTYATATRPVQPGLGRSKDDGDGGLRDSDQRARLRPIQIFWISEPDTDPNKVGSLGVDC